MTYVRCLAKTSKGKQCKNGAIWGTPCCGSHQDKYFQVAWNGAPMNVLIAKKSEGKPKTGS
jgi:hypothetical protein